MNRVPDREVNAETRVSDEKEATVRKPHYDRAVAAVRRVMGIPWSVAAAAALDASGVWERIEELERENVRLREALVTLRAWDMLTLDNDGHGVATGDAPWAVALIDAALAETQGSPSGETAE